MRGLKKLMVWTLIPVLLELAGFLYVDKFYLNDETTFNAKKVDLVSKKANKINVNVPDDAQNIGVSYSGNYISYCENGTINVTDTAKNKTKQISFDGNSTFSMYKWLPDRDIMLISYKYISDSGKGYIKFQSYNAKKDETTSLNDAKNKELSIPLNDSRSDVQDITLSTATNVTYVQIGLQGTLSRIYRINVMAQVEPARFVNCSLGNISTLNKEDKLVYEDRTYNRIRVAGMANPIATGENAIHYLLNTDDEDRIYIGNGTNNQVSKIYIASLNGSKVQLKTIDLKQAVNKNDIYVSKAGKIYINDSLNKKVTELESGKETGYKGSFEKIYDFGIISENSGKLTGCLF